MQPHALAVVLLFLSDLRHFGFYAAYVDADVFAEVGERHDCLGAGIAGQHYAHRLRALAVGRRR